MQGAGFTTLIRILTLLAALVAAGAAGVPADTASARAESLYSRQQWTDAEAAFLACAARAAALYAEWLTRHPGSPLREKSEYQRAGALWMAKDFAAAVSAFEPFLEAHPTGRYAEEARRTPGRARSDLENRRRAEALAAAGKTTDDPLADDLALAERKLRGELPAEAVKVFNHFRGKHAHPQWGRAWYGYGLCRRALGEPEKALGAWDEVLRQAALFTNTLCAAECRRARADVWFEDLAEPGKARPEYLAARKVVIGK